MTFSFSRDPKEAIAYLKDKKPQLHFDYDEIMHEAHHKAFTVAKITRLDLLSDIHASLIHAQKEGIPLNEWKKRLKPTLKQKGWWGDIEVTNPRTGEVKQIYVGSRRLRTIFYTNARVSYNVGRAQMQYALPEAQYLRYVAILDGRTRPSHAKNHGVIRHRDDAFWATHYPPNGWNCRCRVQAYSLKQIKRQGWEGKLNAPLYDIAHSDWRYDVRHDTKKALEAYAKKRIAKAPKELAAAAAASMSKTPYEVRKKQLNKMIDEVIVNEDPTYPINVIEIGVLTDEIVSAIKSVLDKKVETYGIVLEKSALMHASPKRKDAYKNPKGLTVDNIREIVDVLDNPAEIYIDTDPKHGDLVYVFPDQTNTAKKNKIIIHPNRSVKKFGKTNAVVTLDKGSKKEIEKNIEAGVYIRVK